MSPRPTTSESWESIKPRDIAGALTALEGGYFKRIRPADLLIYVNKFSLHNRVQEAKEIHDKIRHWVKKVILDHDSVESRSKEINVFASVVQVCALV